MTARCRSFASVTDLFEDKVFVVLPLGIFFQKFSMLFIYLKKNFFFLEIIFTKL